MSDSCLSADLLVTAALEAGVQALVDDAALFDRTLSVYPAAQRARIRTQFLAHRPNVQAAFARLSDPWPRWSVCLGGSSPSELFIGHRLGVDSSLGAHGSKESGYLSTQTVDVYLHCEHPNETRVHDLLAQACILGQALWMIGQGAHTVIPSNIRDLRPEETYLPENVYTRVQSWEIGGMSVAFEQLPAPKTEIYAHLTGVTVDGHSGRIVPVSL